MIENGYLKWLSSTKSRWWCDSAVVGEVEAAIENGATGVTTNPLLICRSLYGNPEYWKPFLEGVDVLSGDERAEEIIKRVTIPIAELLLDIYGKSEKEQGFVCAQVNPSFAGDRDSMLKMAKRLHGWAPNIAIKLPATAAGLDVIEECAALGLTTVGTVSFTAAQAVAVALRQHRGALSAERSGITPAAAFSVIMVGRLDDYLRDLAMDQQAPVEAGDILWAGTAAIKNAYKAISQAGLKSKLMPAGMRGAYHATELAGADMNMSIASGIQSELQKERYPYEINIGNEIPADVLARLKTMPEFIRSYEPDGMTLGDFISFGATQKTLSQFVEAGWQRIKEYYYG